MLLVWLIERCNNGCPVEYYTGKQEQSEQWTANPFDAYRYYSKDIANETAKRLGNVQVTEHQFDR